MNYREKEFATEIPASTQGKALMSTLILSAAIYVEKNYQVAAKSGRVIQVGMMKELKT
ncbi:hypothetical protein ACVXG7_10430 [Enterobacter hormaechei]